MAQLQAPYAAAIQRLTDFYQAIEGSKDGSLARSLLNDRDAVVSLVLRDRSVADAVRDALGEDKVFVIGGTTCSYDAGGMVPWSTMGGVWVTYAMFHGVAPKEGGVSLFKFCEGNPRIIGQKLHPPRSIPHASLKYFDTYTEVRAALEHQTPSAKSFVEHIRFALEQPKYAIPLRE